jgi:acyl-CoA dehydrogenase
MSQYYFTEEHQLFRHSLRSFLSREIAPHIDAWEAAGEIPKAIFQRFGELDYFGLNMPAEYGGMGLDFFFTVILLEEMQRLNSGGFIAAMGTHAYLAMPHLEAVGTTHLKEKYLRPGIAGKMVGCLAITEPNAGSDVAAIRTKAVKNGNEWVINGSKTFITNGVNSEFLVVAAKTNPDAGANGISLFVMDRNSSGLSATKLNKLGWRCSDTGEIAFDNVRIAAENLLGQENAGFVYIMQRFALERLIVAVGAMAAADYALEVTLKYMSERSAFGRTINHFQELRHRIAQMAAEIESQRQFIYHICQRYQEGEYLVKEAAMAKLLATQLSDKVMTECLQFHGGYGFMEDYPLARMFRDSRLGPIGGGTSEIMKEIIAKAVIDDKNYGTGPATSHYFQEDHHIFRQGLKAFLAKEVKPFVDAWEESQQVPKDLWPKFGEMGYLGLNFPEAYGGTDADFWYTVIFMEEVWKCHSGGFAIMPSVISYMSAPYIARHGSDTLKEKYLPKTISGEYVCAIGISEPGAGSDVANIRTKADRQGDHYIVNGAKTFITNGVYGDYIVTVVKTNSDAGASGISLLVIDRNAPGVSARKLKKLGWHASDTAELNFDNVRVPVENLIGQEGQGFYYLMGGLQLERLVGAIGAVAAAEEALAYSMQYMSERQAFGRTINKFQVLRHRVAQLASEIECVKQFIYYCCRLHNDGHYAVKESSMAKLLATELSDKVVYQCLQFFGGYGFMEEFKIARMFRDSRVGTIGAGTSEIMREIIAKMVIDDKNYRAAETIVEPDYQREKAAPKEAKTVSGANGSGQASSASAEPFSMDSLMALVMQRAGSAAALGHAIRFDLEGESIVLDGRGGSNQVSMAMQDVECVIRVARADFHGMLTGSLNPMQAFLSGKLKVDGNMGVAMKLGSFLG